MRTTIREAGLKKSLKPRGGSMTVANLIKRLSAFPQDAVLDSSKAVLNLTTTTTKNRPVTSVLSSK